MCEYFDNNGYNILIVCPHKGILVDSFDVSGFELI